MSSFARQDVSAAVAPGDAVAVAQRIADDHLLPTAQDVDRSALVDRDRFRPMATAGLFGIAGPSALGVSGCADLDASTMRRVMAAVSSGCGATFFVWAQHHGVVRTLRSSLNADLRESMLGRLCGGEMIGGTAFAHLRRSDRRAITASRVDGGWSFDGFAPWATSWGLAEIFTIAAESPDGEVIWVVIDGHEQPGLEVIPLALPVFGATGTVAFSFDAMVVPDERVLAVLDSADEWRQADRRRAAAGQTGVLGVADRAITLLAQSGRDADDQAGTTAQRLGQQVSDVWRRDDVLVRALGDGHADDDMLRMASDHRSRCLDIGRRATTALLAAVGGGGMDLAHPAQRLAREAAFYVIQAQTADGRDAILRNV